MTRIFLGFGCLLLRLDFPNCLLQIKHETFSPKFVDGRQTNDNTFQRENGKYNIPSPSGKTCSGLSTNWAKSQVSLGNLLHLGARFRALVHEGKMTFCINVTPVRTLCIHHLRKSLPLASFPLLSEAWSPFYIIHLFLSWDCSTHFLCATFQVQN